MLSESVGKAAGDSSKLTESFKTMGGELFSGRLGSFDAGEDFATGYFNGVLARKGLVRGAASDIGNESVDALAESIDAHSPSRKTRELALMWGAGFFEIGRAHV